MHYRIAAFPLEPYMRMFIYNPANNINRLKPLTEDVIPSEPKFSFKGIPTELDHL